MKLELKIEGQDNIRAHKRAFDILYQNGLPITISKEEIKGRHLELSILFMEVEDIYIYSIQVAIERFMINNIKG